MGRIFFISDLHFGHENMAKKRGFSSVEEHDNHIIEKWNSVVNKKDTVWVLGDISMERSQPYELLNKLKGFKKVVLGNHCLGKHVPKLLEYVNSVCGMASYKGCILTHAPIHPTELNYRFTYNIHGHVHENTLPDERYINVSCEAVDYTPQLFDNLIYRR